MHHVLQVLATPCTTSCTSCTPRYAPASPETHDKVVEEHRQRLEEAAGPAARGGKKKKN